MSISSVRLTLWSLNNFTGRRIIIRRGVAVRNMAALRFNNALSSFQLRNVNFPRQVTLVLFSGINFTGSFRVFRGSQSVANLSNFSFNNVTSSFILVNRILTDAQIATIQRTGKSPIGVTVITQ